MALEPNYTINTWPTTMTSQTLMNIELVVTPLRKLNSSKIFLEASMFQIWNKTKMLKTTVRCLEGVTKSS